MAGLPIDGGTVLLYTAGFFLLYLCCWFFIKPIKWILKLGFICALGGVVVFLWNLVGNRIGIALNLNPLTAIFTGILGLPGMILAGILSSIL